MARAADGTCRKCHTLHDPTKCQGHVDEAKAQAYAEGGREARDRVGREGGGPLRQCRLKPCVGQRVCWKHGGATPGGKAKGQRVRQEVEARRLLATYGVAVDTNPVDALLDEVRWTAGHVAWLREKVQEVEQETLVWGKTEVVNKAATEFAGVDTTEAAKPNVWLVLYQQERKHLVDVCKTAIAVGLAERQVRLAERQGEQLVQVIQAVLGDLRLSPEQQARAAEAVPRHLRAVAG